MRAHGTGTAARPSIRVLPRADDRGARPREPLQLRAVAGSAHGAEVLDRARRPRLPRSGRLPGFSPRDPPGSASTLPTTSPTRSRVPPRVGRRTAAVFARDSETALHDALVGRGFAPFSQSPEMVCDARLEDRPAPEGVTVRSPSRPTTSAPTPRSPAMRSGTSRSPRRSRPPRSTTRR